MISNIISVCIYYIVILSIAAYLSLYERKLIARTQLRYGPRYCGACGIYQPIADGLKLFFKKETYNHLSIVSIITVSGLFFLSLLQFSFLPIVRHLKFGLLYVITAHSLICICEILIGCTSSSKYGIIGGVRGIFQSLANNIQYLLIVIFISKNGFYITSAQFHNVIIVFLYFFILLININRTPFDFIEAESELVAGTYTEYGGILFGMIYISDYLNMLFHSILFVLLFFTKNINTFTLSINVFLVVSLIIIIRGVFPRYLQQNLMNIVYKILIPSLFILNVVKYC